MKTGEDRAIAFLERWNIGSTEMCEDLEHRFEEVMSERSSPNWIEVAELIEQCRRQTSSTRGGVFEDLFTRVEDTLVAFGAKLFLVEGTEPPKLDWLEVGRLVAALRAEYTDPPRENSYGSLLKRAADTLAAVGAQVFRVEVSPGEAPSFEEAWKKKEAEGYQYGRDALEGVRFGWELRDSYTSGKARTWTEARVAELEKAIEMAVDASGDLGLDDQRFIIELEKARVSVPSVCTPKEDSSDSRGEAVESGPARVVSNVQAPSRSEGPGMVEQQRDRLVGHVPETTGSSVRPIEEYSHAAVDAGLGPRPSDATPEPRKAAVSLIQREDGRVLCVWNLRYNGFSLPGGMVEPGETVDDALRRELREETSCEVVTAEKIFEGTHGLRPKSGDRGGRASVVVLFRVTASGEPREVEPGCRVDWLTWAEFLAQSPFGAFYRHILPELPVPRSTEATPEKVCLYCRTGITDQERDELRHLRQRNRDMHDRAQTAETELARLRTDYPRSEAARLLAEFVAVWEDPDGTNVTKMKALVTAAKALPHRPETAVLADKASYAKGWTEAVEAVVAWVREGQNTTNLCGGVRNKFSYRDCDRLGTELTKRFAPSLTGSNVDG